MVIIIDLTLFRIVNFKNIINDKIINRIEFDFL